MQRISASRVLGVMGRDTARSYQYQRSESIRITDTVSKRRCGWIAQDAAVEVIDMELLRIQLLQPFSRQRD